MALGNSMGIGIPMVQLGLGGGGAVIDDRFIISVKTDNAGGSADNQFTLPTTGGGYNYDIETSDGQTITGNTGNTIITFPSPGIYDIMISGDFPRYRGIYSPDPRKLIDIKNWGTNPWLSFDGSFDGAFMTIITAADIPNLESVQSMQNMFGNTAYNLQGIPNIENWNVSNVTSTRGMFSQSSIIINPQFPIDLSSWDTSSLIDMRGMFNTVQQPTVLIFDLSNWDISNVTDLNNLFRTGGFASVALYNNTLISWALQNVNNNLNVNFGNSQYTLGGAAETARNTLINTYGWTITDGGGI